MQIEGLKLLQAGKIVHHPAKGKQDKDQKRNQPVQPLGRGRVIV